MSAKKTSSPRKIGRVAMTVDGKLLAGEGGGKPPEARAAEDLIEEIHLEISPEILGGAKTPTITGPPGDFLPKPVDFRMTSMKVKGGRCLVKYRRVSDRAC